MRKLLSSTCCLAQTTRIYRRSWDYKNWGVNKCIVVYHPVFLGLLVFRFKNVTLRLFLSPVFMIFINYSHRGEKEENIKATNKMRPVSFSCLSSYCWTKSPRILYWDLELDLFVLASFSQFIYELLLDAAFRPICDHTWLDRKRF